MNNRHLIIINSLEHQIVDNVITKWQQYITDIAGEIYGNSKNIVIYWPNNSNESVRNNIKTIYKDVITSEMLFNKVCGQIDIVPQNFAIIANVKQLTSVVTYL